MGGRPARDWINEYDVDGNGCWIFRGAISSNGYGNLNNEGAHRWFYRQLRGPIPDGLTLDHLCKVRRCVNPDHLEPVTYTENNRRKDNVFQSHCPRGHEMTPDNTYMGTRRNRSNGNTMVNRLCRTCGRERMRATRAAQREGTAA